MDRPFDVGPADRDVKSGQRRQSLLGGMPVAVLFPDGDDGDLGGQGGKESFGRTGGRSMMADPEDIRTQVGMIFQDALFDLFWCIAHDEYLFSGKREGIDTGLPVGVHSISIAVEILDLQTDDRQSMIVGLEKILGIIDGIDAKRIFQVLEGPIVIPIIMGDDDGIQASNLQGVQERNEAVVCDVVSFASSRVDENITTSVADKRAISLIDIDEIKALVRTKVRKERR